MKKNLQTYGSCVKRCLFDMMYDILDTYSNKYDNTIKIKCIYVKSNSYPEYNVDSNAKDPKFKIDYHVRTSKYKNIFAKGYAPSWSKEVL